jgi:hypothetical protein
MKNKTTIILFATLSLACQIHPARAQNLTGHVLFPITGTENGSLIFNVAKRDVEGQRVGTVTDAVTGFDDATLWSVPLGALTTLNPAGYSSAAAHGTDGNYQVGDALPAGTGHYHAALWNGSAASFVDLNPSGFDTSGGNGVGGGQQVGAASTLAMGANSDAFLWTGTAASAVNLSPAGFTSSEGYDTDGVNQVGDGITGGVGHALLWSGTAASAVDLGPGTAYGVFANQQVGLDNHLNATLWTGSAASAIDLNLPSLLRSTAYSTNGTYQVGNGQFASTGQFHAFLWSGTAASMLDLQPLLPGQYSDSAAYYIDPSDNVFGEAYGTYNGVTGEFAVEWSPTSNVPEPATASLILISTAGFLFRPRRRA